MSVLGGLQPQKPSVIGEDARKEINALQTKQLEQHSAVSDRVAKLEGKLESADKLYATKAEVEAVKTLAWRSIAAASGAIGLLFLRMLISGSP